jgi:hypothetical protein
MRFPQTDRSRNVVFFIVLTVLLLASSAIASAACQVITPTGSGSMTGSDWGNACAGFTGSCAPASLVRGNTYYVGKGSYRSVTFTPISGTTPIVIQAPTVAGHCTDTGFVAGTHVGQAKFTAPVNFLIDYLTWDGSYQGTFGCSGAGCANDPTTYGFYINNNNGSNLAIDSNAAVRFGCAPSVDGGCGGTTRGTTSDRFVHTWVEGSGPSNNSSSGEFEVWYETSDTNDYFGYNMVNQPGIQALRWMNTTNYIAEHNWLQNNGAPGNHSEMINWQGGSGTWTFRYNYLENSTGTGDMSTAAGGTPTGTGTWEIYGNVFFHNVAEKGNWPQPDGAWNGIFHWHDFQLNGSILIYNNTFANYKSSGGWGNAFVCQGDAHGGEGVSGLVGTMYVKNNIFYEDLSMSPNNTCAGTYSSNQATFVWDHNAYYNTSNSDSDSNRQTFSSNPFVNAPRDTLHADNYRLVADTAAWTALSAPYNVDMFGNIRTSSRGAIQFTGGGGGGGAVAPPSGLGAIVR